MRRKQFTTQAIESLKVVPTDIQHVPKVLQRFKAACEPLVKAFSNLRTWRTMVNQLSHELITWTPPKESITLLEFFGGINTSLKALLQSWMVVRKFFYVDIDSFVKQVAASKMMELTTRFSQQFATVAWKASFTFLPSDIQLI